MFGKAPLSRISFSEVFASRVDDYSLGRVPQVCWGRGHYRNFFRETLASRLENYPCLEGGQYRGFFPRGFLEVFASRLDPLGSVPHVCLGRGHYRDCFPKSLLPTDWTIINVWQGATIAMFSAEVFASRLDDYPLGSVPHIMPGSIVLAKVFQDRYIYIYIYMYICIY